MPAVPPTSGALSVTPFSVDPTAQMLRPVGTDSRSCWVMTCCWVDDCRSTTGDAPDTVMVSSRPPTRMSALIGAVKFATSSIPVRVTTENPVIVNVTV